MEIQPVFLIRAADRIDLVRITHFQKLIMHHDRNIAIIQIVDQINQFPRILCQIKQLGRIWVLPFYDCFKYGKVEPP